jgi:hypothetical protein
MKTSFQNFLVGDRVSIVVSSSSNNSLDQLEHNGEWLFFNDSLSRYNGEIIKLNKGGCFDILYDDGHIEKAVHRSRLRLDDKKKIKNNDGENDSIDGTDLDEVSAITPSIGSFANVSVDMSKSVKMRNEKKLKKKQKKMLKIEKLRKSIETIEQVDFTMYDRLKTGNMSSKLSFSSTGSSKSARRNNSSSSKVDPLSARSTTNSRSLPTETRKFSNSSREAKKYDELEDFLDICESIQQKLSQNKNDENSIDDVNDDISLGSSLSNIPRSTVPAPPSDWFV